MFKKLCWDEEFICLEQFSCLMSIFTYLKSRGLGILETENTINNYKDSLAFIESSLLEGKLERAFEMIFGEGERSLIIDEKTRFISTSKLVNKNKSQYGNFLTACSGVGFIYSLGEFFFNPFYNLNALNNEDKDLVVASSDTLEIQVLFMGENEIKGIANSLFYEYMALETKTLNQSIKGITNRYTSNDE